MNKKRKQETKNRKQKTENETKNNQQYYSSKRGTQTALQGLLCDDKRKKSVEFAKEWIVFLALVTSFFSRLRRSLFFILPKTPPLFVFFAKTFPVLEEKKRALLSNCIHFCHELNALINGITTSPARGSQHGCA